MVFCGWPTVILGASGFLPLMAVLWFAAAMVVLWALTILDLTWVGSLSPLGK